MFFNDLYALFVYFVCAIVISYVAFAISYIFGIRADDSNKLAAYECGFTPFDDARNTFEIHFYLVAILFLMFDLEISFLFPWAISLSMLSVAGYFAMVIFFVLLTIATSDVLNKPFSNKSEQCVVNINCALFLLNLLSLNNLTI